MSYGYNQQQQNYGGGYAQQGGYGSYDHSAEDAVAMLDNDPHMQSLFQNASQQVGTRGIGGADPNELASQHNEIYGAANSGERGLFGGGETPFAWQAIAGAAGWQAMKWYEDKQKMQGQEVNHAFMKKAVAGIAMSQVMKLFGQFGVTDQKTREAAASAAAANAMQMYDREVQASGGGYGGNNEPGYGGGYNQGGGYGGGNNYNQSGGNNNYNQSGGYGEAAGYQGGNNY